jgi:hypothetical protein
MIDVLSLQELAQDLEPEIGLHGESGSFHSTISIVC